MKFHEIFFREKCPLVWSAAMKQTWFLGFFPGVECCEWFSGTSLAAGHVTSPQHSFIQICFSFFFVIMPFRCWCYSRHCVWPTESQDRRSVYLTKVSALLLGFNESFNEPSQFKISGRGFVESGKLGYHSIALFMFYKISFGLNSIKLSVELKIGRNDKVGKRWRARYSSSFWNY